MAPLQSPLPNQDCQQLLALQVGIFQPIHAHQSCCRSSGLLHWSASPEFVADPTRFTFFSRLSSHSVAQLESECFTALPNHLAALVRCVCAHGSMSRARWPRCRRLSSTANGHGHRWGPLASGPEIYDPGQQPPRPDMVLLLRGSIIP
jgi:hypothetical protein